MFHFLFLMLSNLNNYYNRGVEKFYFPKLEKTEFCHLILKNSSMADDKQIIFSMYKVSKTYPRKQAGDQRHFTILFPWRQNRDHRFKRFRKINPDENHCRC